MLYLAPIVTSFTAIKNGACVNRLGFAKLVTGACLAVLFASMVFGPLGFGRWYVDQLEHRVRAALDDQQMTQVQVAVVRQPALRRSILLSGPVDAQQQASAITLVKSVPGVNNVSWVADANAGNRLGQGFSVRY